MNYLFKPSTNGWPFPTIDPLSVVTSNLKRTNMSHLYDTKVFMFETTIDLFKVTGEARLEEFQDQPPFIWIDEVYIDGKLLPKTMVSDWLERKLEDVVYQQWVQS